MPDVVRRAFVSPDPASELIVRIANARHSLAPDQLRAFTMMLDGAIAQTAASRMAVVPQADPSAPMRLGTYVSQSAKSAIAS